MRLINSIKENTFKKIKSFKKTLGRKYYQYFLNPFYKWRFDKGKCIPEDSVIYVNPHKIEYYLLSSKLTRDFRDFSKSYVPKHNLDKGTFSPYAFINVVLPSDWDLYKKPYEFDNVYKGMSKYFIRDQNHEEIEYLQECQLREKLGRKETSSILKDKKELYHSMERKGYMSQYDLNKKEISESAYKRPSEICVNIGRDGELIFNNSDAHHRLAIAKILDINKVPVVVVVRHKKWENIRRDVIKSSDYTKMNERSKQNITHPDINYLLN